VQRIAKELREGLVLVLLLGLGIGTLPAQTETTGGSPDQDHQEKENLLSIKSMGARAFGGTTIPMPDDPTNFQACDHGYTDWFIPPETREHPMVLVHGSSARTYQTTFNGRPGFQTIFLRRKYPVYLVDLPWTGRAGKACQEYTWNPVNPTFSARFVFTNRVGLWPVETPESDKEFFPGVSFPRDSASLDQYFRNQYVELNDTMNVRIETDALAVLLEELHEEHGAGAILHTHSSSAARGLVVARKTDKLAGQIIWEPSASPVFPEGELPPPLRRADDSLFAAGTEIPLEEFLKLTTHPILIIWGDFIPSEPDPANLGPLENRRLLVERYRLFAEAINNQGGKVTIVHLPDVGIQGNTHYPMSDRNITQVAAVVSQWLKEEELDKRKPDKR
jgi:hypothetical protein